jgi:cytochrome c
MGSRSSSIGGFAAQIRFQPTRRDEHAIDATSSNALTGFGASTRPENRLTLNAAHTLNAAQECFVRKDGCDGQHLGLRAAKDLHMRLIAFLATFLLLPHLSFAQESALERHGEQLLRTECARCHAIGRSGTSPNSEAPPFRQLSRKYPIDGLAEALAEGLSVGHAEMPEFVFDADEVAAIIAYLKSIQER